MFATETSNLLKTKLPALPRIVLEPSLSWDIDDLAGEILPKGKLAVVDDAATSRALGDTVFRALQKTGGKHITLPGSPTATDDNVAYVREQSKSCDALVAVGSGTVSDICKYASSLDKKPYIVFPTAASMNGYLSANASITIKGYKKTVPGQMPLAVFCDLSVIAGAPSRFTKSGLGDSMARPTAQADWLLSHLLLGTKYDETPFALLKPYEGDLFDHARGVAKSDPETIKLLMQILLLSGLGMTIAGGSYPASQGEHMIAHAYNMYRVSGIGSGVSKPDTRNPKPVTLHGEEVAVTALAMARRQEILLTMEPIFADMNFPEIKITEMFGEYVSAEAKKSYQQKLELIKSHAIHNWESIAAKIEPVLMPSQKMQTILQAAECPVAPVQLGWNQDAYMAVSGVARFLRERFTFLDII